jgi:hypothetical protein
MLSKRFFSENGEVARLSMMKYGEELERQQKYHGATRWFVACLRVCSSFLSLESALASGDFDLAIRFIAREQTPQALEDALSIARIANLPSAGLTSTARHNADSLSQTLFLSC